MWGGKQLYAFKYDNGTVTLTTNADKYTWYVPFRCRPIRAGVTVTTVLDGAATVKFDRVPTPGSASGRGDGDCGMITIPTTTAAGKVYYDKTNYYYGIDPSSTTAGNWCELLDEGESVVFELTSAATSGAATPWLIVEIDSEQPGNNSNMTLTA